MIAKEIIRSFNLMHFSLKRAIKALNDLPALCYISSKLMTVFFDIQLEAKVGVELMGELLK